MSLLKPLLSDGGLARVLSPGDLVVGGEAIPATLATTAPTITAIQLMRGFLLRSPVAGATDTLDSAANIIATLINAGLGVNSIPAGTTWRVTWIVTTAQTTTVQATANTGVTVTRGAIAASSSKVFLFTVVNGTPVQSLSGVTTNTSAVITGFTAAQLALLSVGMIVTNVVAGLQATTIIGIDMGAGTVTMSAAATATGTNTITFSPVVLLEGIGAMLI